MASIIYVTLVTLIIFSNGLASYYDECKRDCRASPHPRICKYDLTMEDYPTFSPACGNCPENLTECANPQCIVGCGIPRLMCSINRQYPAPPIEVCFGDEIMVVLHNKMLDSEVTLHWHGMDQIDTPWMDGPPMVTQCPVAVGDTFVYKFKPDRPGTYWYHSHKGVQTLDGCQGVLVVRQSITVDRRFNYYDLELRDPIFLSELMCEISARDRLPGRVNALPGAPEAFHINGRGVRPQADGTITKEDLELKNTLLPLARYKVPRGVIVKIRVIFGFSVCRACFSITGHKLVVIETDVGNPVRPYPVDWICGGPGDRIVFLINTNQQVGAYWMVLRGLDACSSLVQVGLIHYEGSPNYYPNHGVPQIILKKKSLMNHPGGGCGEDSYSVCISELRSHIDDPKLANSLNSQALHIEMGFYQVEPDFFTEGHPYNNYLAPRGSGLALSAHLNNMTYAVTPSPLLTQYCDIPKSSFCSKECMTGEYQGKCYCTAVYKFKMNTVLTIIVSAPAPGVAHPFHLHGYQFCVLQQSLFRPGDRKQQIRYLIGKALSGGFNTAYCPRKDTILIPPGGYAVITLYTDNPGMWFMHCHMLFHQDRGMASVLQIGEPSQMKKPPPNFPKCQNYYGDSYDHVCYHNKRTGMHLAEPNPLACSNQCLNSNPLRNSDNYWPYPTCITGDCTTELWRPKHHYK